MIDLNQAFRDKRPEYQKWQPIVLLLHAPSHTAKPVKKTTEAFAWEILSHAASSPNSIRLLIICIDGPRTC